MKRKLLITIDIETGSDFQERMSNGALKTFLRAWKEFYEEKHKNNKIKYVIEEKQI